MKTNVFSGIFLAAFIACPGAGAESAPRIQVNGETINTEAVIINDRTYVPLRGVLEKTGAPSILERGNAYGYYRNGCRPR